MRCFLFFLLICFYQAGAQSGTANGQLLQDVHAIIKEKHIDYEEVFPLVPERMATSFLRQLSDAAIRITQPEAEQIKSSLEDFSLDYSYTQARILEFREMAANRLRQTLQVLGQMEPQDFYAKDSVFINLDEKEDHYPANEARLANRWRQFLKFEVLSRFKDDSVTLDMDRKERNQFLNERMRFEITSETCRIESLLQENQLAETILNLYVKAFCLCFDPHTNYLSAQEEGDFITSLSSELYSTGITYGKSGSRYFVSQISPFSYASFHREIRVGDELTGVVVDDELVSLACISPDKLRELFYGEETQSLELEIKSKQDRTFKRYNLSKSMVSNATNHTYSYILKNGDLDIGYVQFPSFYSPYSPEGRSSAEDMALILLALKKKQVDGVIIDFRNNTGGSIGEAADLLGYFTDYGPLFSVTMKEFPEGELFKDGKRGKLVDGRVIFLVNALSASASELVAAAMQTYPGSLIVGSPTYGKATGQMMVPVHATNQTKSNGTVLVTELKIFRFDGTNYQGTGVVPDVQIPTLISKSLVSELDEPYVLEHGPMRDFRQVKFRKEPIAKLNELSRQRNRLHQLDSLGQVLAFSLNTSRYIPLDYENFQGYLPKLDDSYFDYEPVYEVISLEENEAFLEESRQISESKLTDPVLQEAFLIFKDWIDLTATN